MQRFQDDGDLAAFETLFHRHRGPLYAFVRRLARDAEVAADVSQQAWLQLIETARGQRFEPSRAATFRTYLFTLARNVFVSQYIRRHDASRVDRHDPETLEGMAVADGAPDEAAESDETRERLIAALQRLPFEQREVIALWSLDVEIDAIVAITGAPRDTVLSRRKYALAKLRALLLPGSLVPS